MLSVRSFNALRQIPKVPLSSMRSQLTKSTLMSAKRFQSTDSSLTAALNTFNFNNWKPEVADLMTKMPSKETQQHMGEKANFRPTKKQGELRQEWLRGQRVHGSNKDGDWEKVPVVYSEEEALLEASRCIKCADAPCQKGCPSSVDVKSFIQCMTNSNWYGAAKTILSDNPLGLSCGSLCAVENLCASTCTVSNSLYGPIEIGRLQEFSIHAFMASGVPQMRDPAITDRFDDKIALIGCGPASMSCATFLARMGYDNVEILEKENFGGGLVSTEIPAERQPWSYNKWELDQLEQLGVKLTYNAQFKGDFEALKHEGYKAVFLGNGARTPLTVSDINVQNVEDSKTFLRRVCWASKPDMDPVNPETFPKLDGHVLVLGFGDSALDCVNAAFRCGAKRVTCAFRRGFSDMRATKSAYERGCDDICDFIPYSSPSKVVFSEDGNTIEKVEFIKSSPNTHDQFSSYSVNSAETYSVECDHVLTAFGAKNEEEWLQQLIFDSKGGVNVDLDTMQVNGTPWIFAGGDVLGQNDSVVQAANDGKTASWYIHKYLRELAGESVPDEPKLPGFFTPIDLVDLSTEFCGETFINPFGLASAPPVTSYAMMKRAFQEGWGFAVCKTFGLDKDTVINVNPRIIRSKPNLQDKTGFMNIELISEKSAAYWCEGLKSMKEEFPDRIIIGSIMCGYNQADWEDLTVMCNEAGFDMIELNMSCPHGMGEVGMGRACGESTEMVENITRWVKGKTNLPVFPKLTPNVGDITTIAEAAKRGGADGVTAINTMPSMMDPLPNGTPWPAVGDQQHTAYGGSSGSIIRPLAMRKISEIKREVDRNYPIMGTGGVVGPDSAMAMMRYGANVLQVCSAVQAHDYSVVRDLITGVKAHLFLEQCDDLREQGWSGQAPPTNYKHNAPLRVRTVEESLKILERVPKIDEIVGSSLPHIHTIMDMDHKYRLIAAIDEDLCIQCGKCYTTCGDAGYQAILLDPDNHMPSVTGDCTGCALCHAVCPAPGALFMAERPTEFTVSRGIAPDPSVVDDKFLDTIPSMPDQRKAANKGPGMQYQAGNRAGHTAQHQNNR